MSNERLKRDPNFVPVMGALTDDASSETRALRVDPVTDRLKVDANIETGDIEIGAVELKDATTDNRAVVTAVGTLRVDGSGATYDISAATLPLPTGAATSANQTDGSQVTQIKYNVPTNANNINGSLVLAYDGDGNLSTITKTIGADQYQKTLTYTANVLTGVSVWVAL